MKCIETNTWCVGTDGEFFTGGYKSKEEAIKAVKDDYGSGYVGRQIKVQFEKKDVIIPDIEGELSESLFDNVGEVAELWELTKEQEQKFARMYEKFVIDFINRNDLQPTCYRVENIESVEECTND